jgi:hypothetical protein
LLIAMLSGGGLSTYPTMIRAGTRASNQELLRLPLTIYHSSQEILSVQQDHLQDRIQAIAYGMAKMDGNVDDLVSVASQIASGKYHVSMKDLIPRLRDRLSTSSPVLKALNRYEIDGREGFEGAVDGSASIALRLAGASANFSKDTELYDYLKTRPIPSNLDTTTRLMITGLLTSNSIPDFGQLLSNDTFQRISHCEEVTNFAYTVNFLLPPNARKAATDLLAYDLDNDMSVHSIIETAVVGVFFDSKGIYNNAAASIADGFSNYTNSRRDVQSSADDIAAVSAIGAFVIGTVLKSPQAAHEFSTGMQVASLALNLGLMVSTGGIGCLATAGALASGLGGLTGGAPSQGAGVSAALAQVSAQIESLRKEMNVRFDRLESLETQALSLLEQLSRELKQSTQSILGQLTEIRTLVVDLQVSAAKTERDKIDSEFVHWVSQSQGMIEAYTKQEFGPESGYTDQYAKDHLLYFLDHAIKVSHQDLYISNGNSTLPNVVENAGRADLAIAQIPLAAKFLNIPFAHNISYNPVEWARGVQAYLETHTGIPKFESSVVADRARQAWGIGREVRGFLMEFCTKDNIEIAVITYKKAADELRNHLVTSLTKNVGRYPRVGRFPWPKGAGGYEMADYDKHKVLGAHYLFATSLLWEGWSFIPVDQDPIFLALISNAVTMKALPSRSGAIRIRADAEEDYEPKVLGTFQDFSILNRKGLEIDQIRYLYIRFTTLEGRQIAFTAYDPANSPYMPTPAFDQRWDKTRVAKLWESLYAEMNYYNDILAWIEQLGVVGNALISNTVISNFNNIAASFVLMTSVVSWAITDRLDNPWRSGISSQMLRSFSDVQQELRDIASGISRTYATYLNPMNIETVGDGIFPNTENPKIYKSLSERYDQEEGRESQSWEKTEPQQSGSWKKVEKTEERQTITWESTNLLMRYTTLMNTVLANHTSVTNDRARTLGRQLPKAGSGIGYLDGTMDRLTAYLS